MKREDINLNPNAKNIICICIDNFYSMKIAGRLYHCFSKEKIDFTDSMQMLLLVDRLFDGIGFPQASTKTRTFLRKKEENVYEKEFVEYMKTDEVTEQRGTKATFVVHVQYRQNSTWQGSVIWAEKKVTKNFRSALELLKLMDEAIESEEGFLEESVLEESIEE